jgi:hypothetical protein
MIYNQWVSEDLLIKCYFNIFMVGFLKAHFS